MTYPTDYGPKRRFAQRYGCGYLYARSLFLREKIDVRKERKGKDMKRFPAKAILALALAVVLVLGLGATAFAATTVLSNQNLKVNGVAVDCEKYNIDGRNYFKLRDLAALLNGTNSQFNVDYDSAKKQMIITTGVPYTTTQGDELKLGEDKSATAAPSVQAVVIDGEVRDDLTAYNIGGFNFFQLRELGQALGFYVHYDQATRTALVDEAEEDEDFTTGDASLDNPRNQEASARPRSWWSPSAPASTTAA